MFIAFNIGSDQDSVGKLVIYKKLSLKSIQQEMLPVSKLFYIVQKTSASLLTTSGLPEETSRVNKITKKYWCWYVSEKSEDYKLHS